MELEEEFIKEHNLSEDQAKALGSKFDNMLADEKKTIEETFKGQANKDAEGILSGYVESVKKEFGVDIPRNDGEKVKDWAARALPVVFKKQKEDLETLKKDYESKVQKASGQDLDDIKRQYESEKDELLKKYADYDEIKEKAGKADEYGEKLSGLKLQVAFSNVKPSFPDSVNEYEAKAKWGYFMKSINEKYDIELDENNEAVYIDKENKYKTGKLADLVKVDETISELVKGRTQGGTGGRPVDKLQLDGIPFKIEKDATTEQISKSIKEYLTTIEKLDFISPAYAKRFAELNKKVKEQIKQKTAA